MNERVKIEIDAHGVAEVRLTRPDKMNALDAEMFSALCHGAALLQCEPRLRAVLLSGEGKAFCAVLDMANFEGIGAGLLGR